MPITFYWELGRGPRLYIEFAHRAQPSASKGKTFEVRREGEEILIWLWRLHVIYTPPKWAPT